MGNARRRLEGLRYNSDHCQVTFGLTTLLTMAVILDVVTGEMPKSATGLPILGETTFQGIRVREVCHSGDDHHCDCHSARGASHVRA